MTKPRSRIENPHLRRMWALSFVIARRPKAADVWFAEARALVSDQPQTPSGVVIPLIRPE